MKTCATPVLAPRWRVVAMILDCSSRTFVTGNRTGAIDEFIFNETPLGADGGAFDEESYSAAPS